ncbi:hypothetical protein E4U41_001896, partial [Claviceps citrina]
MHPFVLLLAAATAAVASPDLALVPSPPGTYRFCNHGVDGAGACESVGKHTYC